jgi:DNA-binding transcriptional LysR family regulator
MMLDLECVRIFVFVADYGNLTRAAVAAGTVQPVASQRIKKLELALGAKLLTRSPRLVRLTDAGVAFLERARTLLAAHEAALAPIDSAPSHLTVGISDHVLGTRLDSVLKRLGNVLPVQATMSVHVGTSSEVRERYDAGKVDLGLIRRENASDEGEVLGEDVLGWRVPSGWRRPDGPVPLILLPSPCAVRAVAIRALERNGIAWRETFVAGGCLALVAAVRAGLGVAPLGDIVGGELDGATTAAALPPLPASQIVLLARAANPMVSAAAKELAASVREMLVSV